jgi:hypothetical protein
MSNSPTFRFPFALAGQPKEVQQAHIFAFQGIQDCQQAIVALKEQLAGKTSGSTPTVTNVNTTSETVIDEIFPGVGIGTVNNQSGNTSYATQQSDNEALIILNDASPVAVTLNSVITTPYGSFITNLGAGTGTLTPSSGTINGNASFSLPQNYTALVAFDGSNWWASALPIVPILTQYSVLFMGSSEYTEDNANFYYNPSGNINGGPTLQIGPRGSNPNDSALEIYINEVASCVHVHNVNSTPTSGRLALSSVPTGVGPVVSGNVLGQLQFGGSQDNAYTEGTGAAIKGTATQTWSATAQGAEITIQTCPNGSTTLTDVVVFDNTQMATFSKSPTIPAVMNTAAQSTVSASGSGSVIFSQPEQGSSYKKVVIYLNGATGTASYSFPTEFSKMPGIVATSVIAATIVTTLSTSAVTVTGAASTGFILLEGF